MSLLTTLSAETRVNTTTAGNQDLPTVAALSDGGYVVTWYSHDGSSWGIYAQRYDGSGDTVGSETRVNTTTASAQVNPSVAALSDGGYVVTWDLYNKDGSGSGIYAQRYDATGDTVGSETRVNTTTANDQLYASVAALSDGGYVVTWTSYNQDGSDDGIYAQRYDASGDTVGSETRVNTTTENGQVQPSVAALSDGGYVVTWMSFLQEGPDYGIYSQRYDASGDTVGSETHVNTTTASAQVYPAVAALSDGGYVVTWTSNGQDGSGSGIYAQRYDATGNTVGSETRVNTTTAGSQQFPSVAAQSDGGYVVTWMSSGQDGSSDIYAQQYDHLGNAVGGEIPVNTTTANDQRNPSVAALSDGGYVVTWTSYLQDGSSYGPHQLPLGDVYSRVLFANEAPTTVALANATASILENTPTATHIKVADINVTDDALGSNILALTGADAASFEIVGAELFLKAGTVLDFESKASYSVAVTVDDPTVGVTPDATSTTYTLAITNVSGVTIIGTAGKNTIDATHTVAGQPLPTNEEDTINAGGGNDIINALGGNDFINGGGGKDTMIGGTGNDIYVVDNKGDVVTENPSEGIDTVQSSITYVLGLNVENLTLTGTSNVNGTGNAANNLITGNAGNNVLAGLGGADTFDGGAGTDTATYAASATGANVSLATGLGSGGDAQGDTLINIENLTGSNFSDTLEGNAGTNVLNGGAGIDTVSYQQATAAVTINLATTKAQNTVGAGSDTLSNFENLIGSAFNDTLTGSAAANTINGGAGNDTIRGAGGADILTGGLDNDTFVFAKLTDSKPAAPVTITDFVHGQDSFDFSAIDANTSVKADQAFLFGGENANVVAHSVTWTESGGNTLVQADVNGDTTADFQIVLVGTNLNLHATDFIL